jgi:hypothetical protein
MTPANRSSQETQYVIVIVATLSINDSFVRNNP